LVSSRVGRDQHTTVGQLDDTVAADDLDDLPASQCAARYPNPAKLI
jgi:hypothetical protein